MKTTIKQLEVRDIHGDYRFATHQEILAAAEKVINQKFRRGTRIKGPEETKELFQQKIALQENEVFAVLFLDTQNRVIEFKEMFYGTIHSSAVHPRVIAQRALQINAAAVIVAHNHPSGQIDPSQADKDVTLKLKEALALLDVRLLDHIIIGGDDSFSFYEKEYL